MRKYKLGVMVSGSGTIMEAMIRKKLPIKLVMADRDCRGLEIATKNKIPTVLVDRKKFGWDFKRPELFRRSDFSREVAKIFNKNQINLVAMAGFMTMLDKSFFDEYKGMILNTHPALLPSFPGAHAVGDALKYGARVTGCTIHMATKNVDDGKILAQEVVKVLPEDTEESLQERIKRKERKLYPKILRDILDKTI